MVYLNLDGNSKTQSGCLKPLDTGIGPFAAAGYYIEACFGLNSFETAGLDLLRPSSRFVGYAQPSMRMLALQRLSRRSAAPSIVAVFASKRQLDSVRATPCVAIPAPRGAWLP